MKKLAAALLVAALLVGAAVGGGGVLAKGQSWSAPQTPTVEV